MVALVTKEDANKRVWFNIDSKGAITLNADHVENFWLWMP